ncbi:MAG: hypothetical protein JNJ90_16030 [Saprospiraceae bacterium]|jgi:hypothetical protein|nr:hypothetical protein [Saprospiraceae bacterium]
MTNFFKYSVTLLWVTICSAELHAQVVYGTGIITPQGGCQMFAVNTQTCEICVIGPATCGPTADLVVYPDGSYATISRATNPLRGAINIFTPPNFNMTTVFGPVESEFFGIVLAPNGVVYISGQLNGQPALFTYDPITQQINFLGNFPVGIDELYFIGGIMYGVTSGATKTIWQIDVNDPMQSVQIQPFPGVNPFGLCAIDNLMYITDHNKLYRYNPVTNTLTTLCNFQGVIFLLGSTLSAPPPDGDPFNCFCETSAGTLQNQSLDICIPLDASATHNNDHDLDADDLLQFILYSDPADPTGSIIATSATPDFSFAAPLQPGVTYYIAAIAGNDLNGSVDLNDPCLDVSDGIEVTWHPLPSVEFSVSEPDVCLGDCQTVNVTFTGTPPFSLTVSTPAGVLTEVFSGHTGSFQVCPPPGTPPGSFFVQATALVDAFCTCSN